MNYNHITQLIESRKTIRKSVTDNLYSGSELTEHEETNISLEIRVTNPLYCEMDSV